MSKRNVLSLLLVSLSVVTLAQKKALLKWKIKPKEVITYTTTMKEIDSSKYKEFSVNFNGMFGKLGNIDPDSTLNKEIETKLLLSKLNKYLDASLVTYLTRNKNGLIDISVNYKQPDSVAANFKEFVKDTNKDAWVDKMLAMTTKNIQLRGAINDSGIIESFYTKNDQRNLIALLFQLPGKQVKIGESWPLDVHLISMDQNFKCDSSYKKNVVSLVGIKKIDGETIAFLKYDIAEYVSGVFMSPFSGTDKKTVMKISFNALSEFSIDKGRWVSYDGIMSLLASGIMNTNTTKKLSLIAD
jgi:hypothetical protein